MKKVQIELKETVGTKVEMAYSKCGHLSSRTA